MSQKNLYDSLIHYFSSEGSSTHVYKITYNASIVYNISCLFCILQFLILFTHSLTHWSSHWSAPFVTPRTLTWLSVWPVVTQCLCTCVQVTTPTATLWPMETWSAWTKDVSPLWNSTTDGCLWKTLSAGRTASTPGQWSAPTAFIHIYIYQTRRLFESQNEITIW